MATKFAENGQEALEVIERDRPDIVLTDMVMPVMDGLELVRRIKARLQGAPGRPDDRPRQRGDRGQGLADRGRQLRPQAESRPRSGPTDPRRAGGGRRNARSSPALNCLTAAKLEFVLGVQHGSHEPLVGYLQQQLRQWSLCDEADLIRVGTALHEAFVNAIEHGNLELDSDLRNDPDGAYQHLGEQRRKMPPYCHRNVYVQVRLTAKRRTITIRDEGPGFDPQFRCRTPPTRRTSARSAGGGCC